MLLHLFECALVTLLALLSGLLALVLPAPGSLWLGACTLLALRVLYGITRS